jgi:hypothetical protein
MIVDPRRQESLRWFCKLSKVLRQQDHFLNPDMMAHPKKKKSEIPYADLRDENYRVNNFKGKDISHTESDTSVDEEHLLRDSGMRRVMRSFSMTKNAS